MPKPPVTSGETPPSPAQPGGDTSQPVPSQPVPYQPHRWELPEGPWTPPDASTLAFEVHSCLPVDVPVPPPDVKPCEVRTVRPTRVLSKRERFDAEGHPLEEYFHGPDGRLTYTVLHEWKDGREVRRVSSPEGGTSTIQQWTYDEEGRLVSTWMRPGAAPSSTVETRTFYGAQGRIERTEQYTSGSFVIRRYMYGAEGRLESVSWQLRNELPGIVERYTYHPNGQLHTFSSRPPTMGDAADREYDEAGRLLSEWTCTFHGCSGDTREYDAGGQLMRVHSKQEYETFTAEADRLYVRDSAGRVVVDAIIDNVHAMDSRYQERQLHRNYYACGSGALLAEAWDLDADGIVDGWRELELDDEGKLLGERFTGSAVNPEKEWRQYDYQCQ